MSNEKTPVALPTHTFTPAGLATVTRLREMRLQLAPHQKAVARLLYHGSKVTDLYRIDSADLMPPMTVRQRLAAVKREDERICSLCGRYDTAVLSWGQRGRVCTPCLRVERVLSMVATRGAAREKATEWARGALVDPQAIIVAVRAVEVRQPPEGRFKKRSAVVNVVLLPVSGDGETNYLLVPQETPRRKRDIPEGARPIVEVAAEITDLVVGKRAIGWRQGSVDALATDLRDAATGYGKTPRSDSQWSLDLYSQPLRVPTDWETLGHWCSEWVGEINPTASEHKFVRQPAAFNQPLDRAHWMLRTLRRMAETEV